MKLTFERDIPEFKNKTWRERGPLYRQAARRDRRIWVRSILGNLLICAPLFTSLMELAKHNILPSLIWVVVIYFAVGIPLEFLLRALWINPLIKKAVETPTA